MSQKWYESKTSSHQGLVIEEGTGRNVAVTYDKAPLVAAAPDLLAALEAFVAAFGRNGERRTHTAEHSVPELHAIARAAIAKAKGQP